jgi:hypothetical protein
MAKKKIFIAAFLGMAVIGLGIGIAFGMESIKGTPSANAQDQVKNLGQTSGESQKAIGIIGREQHTAAEWAELKSEISASNLYKKLYVASNGREYILTIPHGLESSVKAVETQLEQFAIKAAELEKQRTPEQKAEVVKNIKAMFGVSGVEFLKGTANQEYYRDNAGFEYFVSIPQNKVVRRQMARDFREKNADLIAVSGAWKTAEITKEMATEIASDFIRNKSGISQQSAEKVINEMTEETIKGNYAFFYGDQGDNRFQFEIGIEPVTGKIVRYVNYLD